MRPTFFPLVCRIKGAAAKYPFRKEYKFSGESITQIIHRCFRYDKFLPLKMQSSLVPHFFWGKSAFLCNNMVAMVTIETPSFRPKRWLTLDKNFLFPSTMSLNHGKDQYLLRKNCANVITISNFAMSVIFSRFLWQIIIMKHQIRSKVAFKLCLRRFP